MANVLLTNYCNRQCRYCFAMDKVELGSEGKGENPLFISLEDFKYCLDFYYKSRLQVLSLLGGEPTLHPNFIDIMELCKKNPFFTLIKLFTNGVISDKAVEYLRTYDKPELSIALNINPLSEYSPEEWDKIENVMKKLGPKIGLGYNIWHPGNGYDHLLDLFLKYKLIPHVRLGITQPILGVDNCGLEEKDFPQVAAEIVEAAEKFTRNGLYLSFDCGFPFCMFTLEQHKQMLSLAIKFRSVCRPIIDIGPDLSVWRCFPLSRVHNRNLNKFQTRMEAEIFFNKLFSAYRQFGIHSRCADCNYKKQDLCKGGCLSRVLRRFHGGISDNTPKRY